MPLGHMPFPVGTGPAPVQKGSPYARITGDCSKQKSSPCGLVGPQAWVGGAPPGGNIGHLLAIHTPVTARWRQGQADARQLARGG